MAAKKTPQVFDMHAIITELKGILTTELGNLLETGAADVELIVADIAPILAAALASGDKALSSECEGQLWLVVEISRVRGLKAGWRTVRSVSNVALRALSLGIQIATKGLGGIVG